MRRTFSVCARFSNILLLLFGIVFAAAVPGCRPVAAQESELLIPRMSGVVTIDGTPSEAAWSEAASLPMTMFEPVYDAPITRGSTVRIGHDGAFLYASGVFVDDGPVRVNSLIRDYYGEDDLFNLVIDSFDDDETALWFLVTPAGTRIDGSITDDAEGAAWNHPELDNVWDAAARVTGRGWSAEMRIPLSSLRYDASNGAVRMGLIVGRLIPRLQERHTYPAIRPGPATAQFKPSLAAPVRLEGVDARRPFDVRPYALGGWSPEPRAGGTSTAVGELGADVKVAVGHHATLDLTVNTDFAQTEADDERLNLDRFDLFYPEKRQFFLERSGVFEVGDGEHHQVFYSRRIGLSPEGEPERLYGGLRLTGRSGPWEYGGLSMQTDAAGGSINNTALRVQRRVLNAQSRVGAVATAVVDRAADVAAAGGFDADVHLGGSHFVSLTSVVSSVDAGPLSSSLRLAAEKRNNAGFAYRFSARRVEAAYRPPLGFVRQTGVSALDARVSHGSFSGAGFLQERVVRSDVQVVRRHADARVGTFGAALGVDAKRRGGGSGSAEVRVRHEDVLDAFPVGDAVVPAGAYSFVEGTLTLALPDGWSRRAALSVSGGRFFEGSRLTVGLRPAWNASAHLEITADLETNWIRLGGGARSFRGDVVRLRVRAARDARLSLYGLVQYNGALDRAAANVRVRYNFNEGRDLYVVWNEGWDTRDGLPSGQEPTAGGRSLLVKYSHATRW